MAVGNIKINGTDFSERFASFQFWNELVYATTPERTVAGTLENDRVDSYYVPKCEFTFAKLDEEQYRFLVQNLNALSVIIECYDYELGYNVRRCMAMAKMDRNKLLAKGDNLDLLLTTKFSMESKYAYISYSELDLYATTDTRF